MRHKANKRKNGSASEKDSKGSLKMDDDDDCKGEADVKEEEGCESDDDKGCCTTVAGPRTAQDEHPRTILF